MAEKTKVVKQTKGKVKTPKTFDTGIKAEGRVTIVIPGRGRVVIPNPHGDLYFDGTHTKDTGPTHVKQIEADWIEVGPIWIEDCPTCHKFTINGILSRKDYLFLARHGCTLKNGVLSVPAENMGAVSKYLNIGK